MSEDLSVASEGDLPDQTLRYADHADGVLDLHRPARPNGTLVVLLHGGFWKTAYDRTHTRPMARALADLGYLVATPEYRRVGPGGAGGWPQTGDDVRGAVELALTLDHESAVVTGHSAGGHLALWVASLNLDVDRVVPLAPVANVAEAMRLGLGSGAAQAFFGNAPLAETDPMAFLAHQPKAEVVIVHGMEDDVVPIALSESLLFRHFWIELLPVRGDHYAVIDPSSAAWPKVLGVL